MTVCKRRVENGDGKDVAQAVRPELLRLEGGHRRDQFPASSVARLYDHHQAARERAHGVCRCDTQDTQVGASF